MNNESEIWLHIKSGGFYQILTDDALNESDLTPVTIYKSLWDGAIWVRPRKEFHDGRFRCLNLDEIKALQSIAAREKSDG